MEVLSGILALVFLALLVMFVIGLIAPGNLNWAGKIRSR